MKINHIAAIGTLLFSSFVCRGADLSLDSCLSAVMQHNVALAAEKLNIPIAQAEEHAAAVFNDPSLGFEYANNDDKRMQMGQSYSVELGYTLSPGKRGARRNLARSERELSEALLDDYIRQLRLEATTAWYETVKEAALYRLACELSESMADIARGDSLGVSIGQVRQVDAMSTAINARLAASEAADAATRFNNSRLALAAMMGLLDKAGSFEFDIDSPLPLYPEIYAGGAVEEALDRRADLRAALKNVEVAARQLKVEGAERNMDFDIALGYNYNTEVRNEIAPAPKFSGVTVGVTIPLKFSNANKGTITAARLRQEQAQMQYQQAQTEVTAQVLAAIDTYRRAQEFYLSSTVLSCRVLAKSTRVIWMLTVMATYRSLN